MKLFIILFTVSITLGACVNESETVIPNSDLEHDDPIILASHQGFDTTGIDSFIFSLSRLVDEMYDPTGELYDSIDHYAQMDTNNYTTLMTNDPRGWILQKFGVSGSTYDTLAERTKLNAEWLTDTTYAEYQFMFDRAEYLFENRIISFTGFEYAEAKSGCSYAGILWRFGRSGLAFATMVVTSPTGVGAVLGGIALGTSVGDMYYYVCCRCDWCNVDCEYIFS